jgi:hypothetical protein
LIASKNIGEREVIEKTWGLGGGEANEQLPARHRTVLPRLQVAEAAKVHRHRQALILNPGQGAALRGPIRFLALDPIVWPFILSFLPSVTFAPN